MKPFPACCEREGTSICGLSSSHMRGICTGPAGLRWSAKGHDTRRTGLSDLIPDQTVGLVIMIIILLCRIWTTGQSVQMPKYL